MRRSRVLLGVLSLLLAVLVAGCGGGGGSGASSSGGGPPESAGFVPTGAAGYVYLNTDFGGDQWQTLDSLSKKFPNRQQLLTQIQTALQGQGLDWNTDIKPAFGPDTALAVLGLATNPTPLGLTKPQDEAKLKALIAKAQASDPSSTPPVTETIDGWTAIADKQASLDAAKAAHDGNNSLADNSNFQAAMSELPDDALAKAYVDGVSLNRALRASGAGSSLSTLTGVPAWIAASLEAKDNGLALAAISKGQNQAAPTSFKASLLDKVPSGALVYAGFDNLATAIDQLAQNPAVQSYLGTVEQSFGVTLEQIAALFKGEGAIYARPGTPIPEATIALEVDDPQTALATLDKLAARAAEGLHGQVQHQTIDGVEARRIQLSQFAIYYATFDGLLVITDSPTGITGLKDGGQKMSDDPVFKDVKDAAGMPDETKGFLYVNVKDTVPLVEGLSAFAGGGSIPPDVSANLEHVRAFLAYGSGSGDENRLDAFLQVQ